MRCGPPGVPQEPRATGGGRGAEEFLAQVVAPAREQGGTADESFTVDGTTATD
jgi:hypothetical protein